jgi:hypothetical protein
MDWNILDSIVIMDKKMYFVCGNYNKTRSTYMRRKGWGNKTLNVYYNQKIEF